MTTTRLRSLLHSDGIAPEPLAQLAARSGLDVAERGMPPGPGDVLLFTGYERSRLVEGMSRGYTGCIEWSDSMVPTPDRIKAASTVPGLYLSLSTAVAWMIDSAAIFCDEIESRRILRSERRADVELALHEAIANAIIHGNLALGSSFGEDPGAFDAFCRRLAERLKDPELSHRRVDISVTVHDGLLEFRVRDEGAGYPSSFLPSPADRPSEAKSGRGLEIIRSLAVETFVEDDGRRLVMRFSP